MLTHLTPTPGSTILLLNSSPVLVALRAAIDKHHPDLIVPEIEAIRTEVLLEVSIRNRISALFFIYLSYLRATKVYVKL